MASLRDARQLWVNQVEIATFGGMAVAPHGGASHR